MIITAQLKDRVYKFETKPGLFSKNAVDPGSRLLTENVSIMPTDTVIDLGCGYGAIGLVTAHTAKKVYMVDIDIRATKYSQINAKLNEIQNVEIRASDGFEEVSNVIFDVVLSNPPSHVPKETLLEFIGGAKRQLSKGGRLYFVTEKRIKPLIKREFERVFGNYKQIASDKQYVLSLATKNS